MNNMRMAGESFEDFEDAEHDCECEYVQECISLDVNSITMDVIQCVPEGYHIPISGLIDGSLLDVDLTLGFAVINHPPYNAMDHAIVYPVPKSLPRK